MVTQPKIPTDQIRLKNNKQIKKFQERIARIDETNINVENRTVEVAFSTETPVSRYFGDEILLHGEENVDLHRFQNGGAVLVDHDHRDHIGVVESVRIDADRVGRATLRFSRSERAQSIFDDVIDKIRVNVSVGYEILDVEEDLIASKSDTPTYNVTRWMPYEVSFVACGADVNAGVGRSQIEEVIVMPMEQKEIEKAVENKVESGFSEAQLADLQRAKADAGAEEADRVRNILAIGNKLKKSDMAEKAVNERWTTEKFYGEIVSGLQDAKVLERAESPDLGMSDNEVKQFSFQRLITAMANPNDRRASEAAAFEFECSREFADLNRKEARGAFIPSDVLRKAGHAKRDVTVGGTGSNVVATNLLAASFIDLLVDATPLLKAGHVKMMTGLVGDVAIPKLTGGSAHYWLAENADATLSDVTFGQVSMTPKTLAVLGQISRKLMIQSTPDAEMIIRGDLAREMGLGIHNALINGTGANNQPTGLLNAAGLGIVPIATNGGVITHDLIESLLEGIEVDNAEDGSLIYLTNPKVKKQIRTTKLDAGSGRYLDERMDYPMFITNQVPSGLTKGTANATCSAMILGSFRENLMLGMWSGLDITVDPFTGAASGKTRIVMHQDCDIAIRRVEAFRAIVDIVTG